MKGIFAITALTASAVASSGFSTETVHKDAAPILSSSTADEIPNSYIIKFKDHVTDSSASDHHSWIQKIHSGREDERMELRKRSQFPIVDEVFSGLKHTYNIGDFRGYAGHFDDDVIEQIRNHPDVSPRSIVPFDVQI